MVPHGKRERVLFDTNRSEKSSGLYASEMRGPFSIIVSKQRATCSQEKLEFTNCQAERDTRARVWGLPRSSRQWAAKRSGASAMRMSWGGLTESPSAPMVVETT